MLTEVTRTSFLYPGEIRHILESGVAGAIGAQVSVLVVKESWILATSFGFPVVTFPQKMVEPETGGAFTVTGVVRSENAFSVAKLTLVAIAHGVDGSIAAASQTVVTDLAPFSQRAFSISFPAASVLPSPSAVEIFSEAQR